MHLSTDERSDLCNRQIRSILKAVKAPEPGTGRRRCLLLLAAAAAALVLVLAAAVEVLELRLHGLPSAGEGEGRRGVCASVERQSSGQLHHLPAADAEREVVKS